MSPRFIVGDAVEVMSSLPAESVDTVVTSPPFLGLRNYESGDARELGHETSPGEFIGALLDVCAAIRRVLKPGGSLCLELGDTFADSGGAGGDYNEGGMREGQPKWRQVKDQGDRRKVGGGNRPGGHHNGGLGWPPGKSLCLIPHLFAASLAYERNLLTGDPSPAGEWRIRNVVCWARKNPTPGVQHDKLRVGTSYITIACTEPPAVLGCRVDRGATRRGRTAPGDRDRPRRPLHAAAGDDGGAPVEPGDRRLRTGARLDGAAGLDGRAG